MMSVLSLLLIALASCLFCSLFHAIALFVFPRIGLLDYPERYNLSRRRLPYPTGLIPIAVFLCFFLVLQPWNMQSIGVFSAVLLLALLCFFDDRYRIAPVMRLFMQGVVGGIVFVTGSRIYSLTNPLEVFGFSPILSLDSWTVVVPVFGSLPVLSGFFTAFWIGLTVNALNWFDGISGQVSTISSLTFLTIGLLSLSARVHQYELAVLCFVLLGLSLGCLFFDFPPPRVVMGDTGAMFFGLLLGIFTIYAGGKVATAFLALGVPLIDLFLVILRRILTGRSPLKGSMSGEHLHHRLLAKGWSPRSIIALTAILGFSFGSTALFLNTFSKAVAAILLFGIMLGLSWYSGRSSSQRTH